MRVTYPKEGLSVAGVLVSVYRHSIQRYQSAVPAVSRTATPIRLSHPLPARYRNASCSGKHLLNVTTFGKNRSALNRLHTRS